MLDPNTLGALLQIADHLFLELWIDTGRGNLCVPGIASRHGCRNCRWRAATGPSADTVRPTDAANENITSLCPHSTCSRPATSSSRPATLGKICVRSTDGPGRQTRRAGLSNWSATAGIVQQPLRYVPTSATSIKQFSQASAGSRSRPGPIPGKATPPVHANCSAMSNGNQDWKRDVHKSEPGSCCR